MKTTSDVIQAASVHLATLTGHVFDLLTIAKPRSPEAAVNLAKDAFSYQPTPEYQAKLRELIARYPYRLDTNFAKINRINQAEIAAFKHKVLNAEHHGKTIRAWARLLGRGNETELQKALEDNVDIRAADSEDSAQ